VKALIEIARGDAASARKREKYAYQRRDPDGYRGNPMHFDLSIAQTPRDSAL
jgi:hypothetical protein